MKKLLSLLLVLTMVTSIFAGCGAPAEQPSSSEQASQSVSQQAGDPPINITDHLGRQVELAEKAERIISSYNITTSLLIALDKDENIVGIEKKAEEREIYKKAANHLTTLPQIGSGKGINVEECMALEPDVVIIPVRLEEFIPKFESLGIPVIAVEPESMELFLETIEMIGKAVGAEEKADKIISYYKDNIAEIEKLTKDITERPAVYMTGSSDVLTTCTSKMYQHYLIELAGGKNASQELTDGYWTTISAEQLLGWNPDYIFNLSYSTFPIADVASDAKLANVNAVKNAQLYTFPSELEAWDYPTPSSILGVMWLMQKIHPDLYPADKYEKLAKDFYTEFYGIEVTNTDIGV